MFYDYHIYQTYIYLYIYRSVYIYVDTHIYIYISCGRTINYTYNKLLRNLGTDGTITRTMVLNIKSMAHLRSNPFLSIFLRIETIVFWKMSL